MQKQLSLLTITLLLAACGGGGGDNSTVADQQTPRPESGGHEALFIYQMDNDERFNHPNFDFMINGGRYAYASEADRRVVVDPNTLPRGLSGVQTLRITARKANGSTESVDLQARSYRGFYSGTVFTETQRLVADIDDSSPTQLDWMYVFATPEAGLPTRGRATYHGNAFGAEADNAAAFAYHVDFGEKSGHGEIAANRYHSAIQLTKERLSKSDYGGNPHYEFDGDAHSASHGRHNYNIILAGPNAEEIIGSINSGTDHDALAVYGTRGEITP